MGPAYYPTARSQRFGGWFGLRRARQLAQRLARIALADRLTIRRLLNGSHDNCLTGQIR